MIKKILLFLTALILAGHIKAQVYSQLYSGKQEMFLEAESFHLFEEYNEALPLYLELLDDLTENAFIHYRIGTCYLNLPGQKNMAIEHLEKAITDMDHRDRRPTFRTTKAPLDALFHLGEAYHIDYQFDRALEKYHEFKEKITNSVYNVEIVNEHIQATKNAKESVKHPLFFLEKNLGERINSRFSETNPVVSGNMNVLVFSRKLPFYDGVFFSQKTNNGEWSWPVEITPQIGSDGDCYPVSLSFEGDELYIYKSDDLVGNIYVSRYSKGQWSKIEKLNENINTNYWESHASISKDGKTLYFTSNRPGGFGALDIYYSRRNSRGEWGPAVNMGETINTPYNEDTPFITENGKTLYFSSYGHYNIGGYDVFYSSLLDNGQWSVPLNTGYNVSTPDDDLFFSPVKNGIFAFIAKYDDVGFGDKDIFRYEFFSDAHPRKFSLKGIMGRFDGLQLGPGARITLVNPVTGDTLQSIRPDLKTGEYEIIVEAGEWEVIFDEDQHERIVKSLEIPKQRDDSEISLDIMLSRREPELTDPEIITDRIILPESVRKTKTLGIKQHEYEVTTDDNIRIPMRLDRNTRLEVEKYLDNELIGKESIDISRRRFNYDYVPAPGENVLRFRYTDRDDDIILEDVIIRFSAPEYTGEKEMIDSVITRLQETSGGRLRDVLLALDREEMNIKTPEQLMDYLADESAFFDLSEQHKTVKELIDALLPIVSEEMTAFLQMLIDKEKLPETTEELIKMIIAASEEYGYDKWEIFYALAKLSTADDTASEKDITESSPDGLKISCWWWLILLIILILGAYYYWSVRKKEDRS